MVNVYLLFLCVISIHNLMIERMVDGNHDPIRYVQLIHMVTFMVRLQSL